MVSNSSDFLFVVNKCNWTNDTGCNRELFKSILDFQFEQQNDNKFYDFSNKTQPEKRESVDTGFFYRSVVKISCHCFILLIKIEWQFHRQFEYKLWVVCVCVKKFFLHSIQKIKIGCEMNTICLTNFDDIIHDISYGIKKNVEKRTSSENSLLFEMVWILWK